MSRMWQVPPRSVLIGLLTALLAPFCFGQSDTSSLSGFVKDASDSPVPQATVTITNETTGATRTLQTDASGFFAAPNLPSGYYTARAEAPGFRATEVKENKLDPSVPLSLSLRLTVGDVKESIEVTAAANAVQEDSATIGRLISREQIENLQLNGRNPVVLAQLLPGVNRSSPISSFTFGLESQFNINGSRDRD